MIDFHCHLDLYPSPSDIVIQCIQRRTYVLSVTTTPSAFGGTLALAPSGSRIRTALGLHPELAAKRVHELKQFEELLDQTKYVGEVGLDASPQHRSTLDVQREVLATILQLCARAGGRILTLHSRGATAELLDLLSAWPRAGEFVLHWYAGTPRQVERAAEMGCWFSVGPAMLQGERGAKAVRAMPRDRVVPESDGPFARIADLPVYPWETFSIVPVLSKLWQEPAEVISTRLFSTFKAIVAEK